jgi:hypothetical protein
MSHNRPDYCYNLRGQVRFQVVIFHSMLLFIRWDTSSPSDDTHGSMMTVG